MEELTKKEKKSEPINLHKELGKDEMNLAEFPIALLSERDLKKKKTIKKIRIISTPDDIKLDQEWIITGSDEYGLPLAQDDDVLIALLKVGSESDFESSTINFTRHGLIKIMGWDNQGWSYKRIEDALNRLAGVRIITKNAFYDRESQTYISRNIGILDSFEIFEKKYKRKTAHQVPLSLSYVRISEELYKSIKTGYIKYIDTNFYYSLSSSISKRLYRFLDKKRYHKKKFEINLLHLAETNLGMDLSTRQYASQIKQRMDTAHQELIKKGFLKSAEYQKTQDGKNWKVIYIFTQELSRKLSLNEPSEESSDYLVVALIERGITDTVAKELAKKYPETIEEKIDLLDYAIKTNSSSVSENPAGWLRRAIEEDYKPPKGYKTPTQRKEEKEEIETTKRAQKDAEEKEALVKQKIEGIKLKLPPEELNKIIQDAEAYCKEQLKSVLKAGKKAPDSYINGRVNDTIREKYL